jgi:hypothetical protein
MPITILLQLFLQSLQETISALRDKHGSNSSHGSISGQSEGFGPF